MPLVELSFPPGLYANGTRLQSAGRWYDANLVRFHSGTVRPWGGWLAHATAPVTGKARAMITWTDNAAQNWIAIGTHSKLLIMNRVGTAYDITPLRETTSVTLSDPFATTSGSRQVVVTDTAHGAAVGDRVVISGASAIGGLSLAGSYAVVEVVDGDSYKIEHDLNASATTTGGGAGVTIQYRFSILGAGPFATTSGSATVTVTHAGHGAVAGSHVIFSGAAAVGGITVEGTYEVLSTPDANSYTIAHSAAASSTASGGGSAVKARYQIAPGRPAAAAEGGYGLGDYGEGGYGVPVGDPELTTPATVWTLDTFGERLVACNAEDGRIYQWSLSTAAPAERILAAPEACRSIVVSETGHLMALGAHNDGRLVKWCDAQDYDGWTPGLPSEAGDFPLQTGGRLMAAKRTRGGTLLLTDQDAWMAIYNGGANPFAFDQVGVGCGAVAQGAAIAAGTTLVAWIGQDGFWMFNGDVQPLPCEVSDRVFSDLSRLHASHITGYHRRQYGEMVWHYPSAAASENDRYVVWNYREGHWATGSLSRTCGADRGALPYPLAVGADGKVWRHETGYDYDGAAPFIESGPVQFGAGGEAAGERVFTALDLIPDENTLGDVQATFFGRFNAALPEDGVASPDIEETFGPYAVRNPTNLRFTTRHLRMRLVGQREADWRVGAFKLDIQLGGAR